jgi:hypothetical protein
VKSLVVVALVAACGGHSSSMETPLPDGATDAPASVDAAVDASPPIPPVCDGGECTCSDGYRPCSGGCCVAEIETVTLDGVSAHDVRMEYAPDGTAYILVAYTTDQSTTTPYRLELYKRAPGGEIASTGWIVEGPSERQFDLAIRSDGTVMIAYAPGGGQETTPVELVTWKDGVASQPVRMGNGFAYETGVSATLDADETLWVTWSSSRSGGMAAYSVDTSGTQRTWGFSTTGTIETTDAQYSAALASVFSFYVNRYTGTLGGGVTRVTGTADTPATCLADSAAFDSTGHVWSVHSTYPSVHTYACRDDESVELPDTLDRPRLAVDADDVAYIASYDMYTYTASWYASADNHGWTQGVVPTHYGVAPGWNRPGYARTSLARDPHGRMSIVVAPEDAGMGPMVLATFR